LPDVGDTGLDQVATDGAGQNTDDLRASGPHTATTCGPARVQRRDLFLHRLGTGPVGAHPRHPQPALTHLVRGATEQIHPGAYTPTQPLTDHLTGQPSTCDGTGARIGDLPLAPKTGPVPHTDLQTVGTDPAPGPGHTHTIRARPGQLHPPHVQGHVRCQVRRRV